jgi:hypothetical protein
MTVSVHKVLRAGDCGYHEYLVYTFVGTASKPSDNIGQVRTVLRAEANIFNNYHSSEPYWRVPISVTGTRISTAAFYGELP